MASITPGKIVMLVIAILVLIVSVSVGMLLMLGAAGLAPDNFCKMNAAANSLTPMSMWKIIPNFGCHVREYSIDAYGSSSIFVSSFGKDRICSCTDFYGDRVDHSPESLIDSDFTTKSIFPIINNGTKIYLSVTNEDTLSSVLIDLDNTIECDYQIFTQQKEWFWTVDKICSEGHHYGTDINVQNLDCKIDSTKYGVKIVLNNLSFSTTRISASEIVLENLAGDNIELTDSMYAYMSVNEIQEQCLEDSRTEGIDICTSKWQKKWVEKELIETALRCWSMGGNGRYYGDFECFEGCVYYDPTYYDIDIFSLRNALTENYFFSSVDEEYLPFSEILSEEELLIDRSDFLENGKCFFMKYAGRAQNLIGDDKEANVVITFGRTIAEAKQKA